MSGMLSQFPCFTIFFTVMTVVEMAFKKLSQGLPCWNAQEDGADTRWAEESNEEFAPNFCGSQFVISLFCSSILWCSWHSLPVQTTASNVVPERCDPLLSLGAAGEVGSPLQELTPESVVSPTECLQQEPFASDVTSSTCPVNVVPLDNWTTVWSDVLYEEVSWTDAECYSSACAMLP